MKVIYSGYYGAQNSGDDAFCEIAAWGARKFWSAREHVFFARSVPEIGANANFYSPHASYGNFLRAIHDVFTSDIFVSAGGSTFHSKLKATDLRTYAKAKKYVSTKGKIGAIGISLGPYKNKEAEDNTVSYLRKLDFLALRDQKSFEMAQSYNLSTHPVLAFDLAALLPEIHPLPFRTNKNSKNGIRTIGVAACNYESYVRGDVSRERQRNDFILNVLKEMKRNKNLHYRFFIFNGNSIFGDEKLTYELIQKLSAGHAFSYDVVPYLGNVKETYTKINECDLILSTRLHASIFACYGNTPFFLLEYHRKCTDLLDDLGHDPLYRVSDGRVSVSSVCATMEEILNNGTYTAPKFIEETKARAMLNFTATL